ncbi:MULTISPECIES: hypothetical protein [Pseudomonas syringae group]|uniref:Uncharacterized protein n=1 Tax=Pseudomonas viridiflava TaxID=33069 RepID=A0ABU7N6R8_PSEVI|nr:MULTISPECIES: hypothetical protein [Pseudomonas syringae group]MEE3935518.1 hypothetical protein [Pseudomonas viridiflava]MEE4040645.1 hypothetical protein [Pseudomonas viridiflava]MEE4060963.1 hypothetical protein [Pseudomonas viridiflava]MEE4170540.1 hypothetical protein [Pseudomonas viridiflava]QIQ71368.1 hypothetical protein HBB04_01735 [Pseudomonas coronafaciens]
MKISEIKMPELIEALSQALVPLIYKGLDENSPPRVWRERAQLNADVMGRLVAVMHCGDEIGPEVVGLTEVFTKQMRESYAESFGALLGPQGRLSKV